MWTLAQAVRVLAAGLDRHATLPRAPVVPHRIDPDRASLPELRLLPGIGPERAEAIVLERVRGGPFGSAEALERVPGIGPGTIARVRPWLTHR